MADNSDNNLINSGTTFEAIIQSLDYYDAEKQLKKQIVESNKDADPKFMEICTSYLGRMLYMNQSKFDNVEIRRLKEAIEKAKEQEDKSMATWKGNLGIIRLCHYDQYEKAKECFKEAIQISKESPENKRGVMVWEEGNLENMYREQERNVVAPAYPHQVV